MDVHEGTEILARLGILESKEESPARKKDDSFVDVKFNDDSDSDSGGEIVFDRNALMSSRSRRRGGRRSRAACCIFAESSIFAIVIICTSMLTAGFTLNASPNVYNLLDSPSFTIHFVVQIVGMLSGVLLGRRLVGMISFTSLITLSLITGLGCSLALIFSKSTPAIAVLFVRAMITMVIQYCSISLILAFWRGHRRKLMVLFVCFVWGAALAPQTASERADALVKRQANNNLPLPTTAAAAAVTDAPEAAHLLWDWSGEAALRGGEAGLTADWMSVGAGVLPLLLLVVTYAASCRCGVAIDGRVQRLREVEEFTPLSVGFRIRLATLQVILGMMLTLCEFSRVAAGERRQAEAVQLLVFVGALAAGDTLLSLRGLFCLLGVAATGAMLSLLGIVTWLSHPALFASSALSILYLPLLIDMRVTPRPLLTVDLLMVYPTAARLILPLLFTLPPIISRELMVVMLSGAAVGMMVPLMRSLYKAERVLLAAGGSGSCDPEMGRDPDVLSHRPLTKDDYSALINAIDEESDEESSV